MSFGCSLWCNTAFTVSIYCNYSDYSGTFWFVRALFSNTDTLYGILALLMIILAKGMVSDQSPVLVGSILAGVFLIENLR